MLLEKIFDHSFFTKLCLETAKFGQKGQAHGDVSKTALQQLLTDRVVNVRLLERDQYSRAVAEVWWRQWPFIWRRRDASSIQIRDGHAAVYRGGAYGRYGERHYLTLEENAKKTKRGMWRSGKVESPAEYKRRMKEST